MPARERAFGRMTVPRGEWRRLQHRARQAQRSDHSEVVGLLAISRARPETIRFVFLPNEAPKPGAWKLEWRTIAAARQRLRLSGSKVIGIFHSHPIGKASLGARDRRSTPTGWAHLVYDVCGREARLFLMRSVNGRRRAILVWSAR